MTFRCSGGDEGLLLLGEAEAQNLVAVTAVL
jgi:hypothetical protein